MSAVKTPHSRRFGVEIECGGLSWESATALLKSHGFRNDVSYANGGFYVDNDGTEVEIQTPVLQGGEGFKSLRKIYEILNVAGAYVTEADGMHVHHDAPEFVDDAELQGVLLDSWTPNREIIELMVSKRRRKSTMCPKFSSEGIQQTKRGRLGYVSGYRDLNMATSLPSHGTIEVRLHEGVLDYTQARAWIRFVQKFLYEVVKRREPLPVYKSLDELLSGVKIVPATAAVLRRKAAWHAANEPDKIRQDDGHGVESYH